MSTPDKICKVGASKSNDDDVCDNMLRQLSTVDNEDSISICLCANCGKEGNIDNMNTCNKCKMVKYCNAACKKKHRSKHKKDCEEHLRLAAEQAAKLHDEKLFKEPPQLFDDCPICFLRLPTRKSGWRYMTCCGKVICSGCCYAPVYDNQGNEIAEKNCPFCRTPLPTTEEEMDERRKKRVEANDHMAIYNQGNFHRDGKYGYPQNHTKALELYHRSAELGCSVAYNNIGVAYDKGRGVEVDKKKANYYYDLAAIMGDISARYNLGIFEENAGNTDRALKHYMIAVGGGHNNSLQTIQRLYSNGQASKEDYTKALQLYQTYLREVKSKQRDKAAAADDQYRYY